jgi:hypothetical protein
MVQIVVTGGDHEAAPPSISGVYFPPRVIPNGLPGHEQEPKQGGKYMQRH